MTRKMGPVEKLLRDAGEKITTAGDVCVGHYARDDHGVIVSPTDASAVVWCAMGALKACSPGSYPYSRALGFLSDVPWVRCPLSTFNDRHPELIPDLYSEAIEAAEALGL